MRLPRAPYLETSFRRRFLQDADNARRGSGYADYRPAPNTNRYFRSLVAGVTTGERLIVSGLPQQEQERTATPNNRNRSSEFRYEPSWFWNAALWRFGGGARYSVFMLLLYLVALTVLKGDDTAKIAPSPRPACTSQIAGHFWPEEADRDPRLAGVLYRSGELEICARGQVRFRWSRLSVAVYDLKKRHSRGSSQTH